MRSALLFALLLAGCGGSEPVVPVYSAPDPLAGTSWRVVELVVDERDFGFREDEPLTVAFDRAGGVTGQADCNRMTGAYTHPAPAAVRIGPLALTRRACPRPSSGTALAGALDRVQGYHIARGRVSQLRLEGPGVRIVLLQSAA